MPAHGHAIHYDRTKSWDVQLPWILAWPGLLPVASLAWTGSYAQADLTSLNVGQVFTWQP